VNGPELQTKVSSLPNEYGEPLDKIAVIAEWGPFRTIRFPRGWWGEFRDVIPDRSSSLISTGGKFPSEEQ
jgi:hypothetical protein